MKLKYILKSSCLVLYFVLAVNSIAAFLFIGPNNLIKISAVGKYATSKDKTVLYDVVLRIQNNSGKECVVPFFKDDISTVYDSACFDSMPVTFDIDDGGRRIMQNVVIVSYCIGVPEFQQLDEKILSKLELIKIGINGYYERRIKVSIHNDYVGQDIVLRYWISRDFEKIGAWTGCNNAKIAIEKRLTSRGRQPAHP